MDHHHSGSQDAQDAANLPVNIQLLIQEDGRQNCTEKEKKRNLQNQLGQEMDT